MKDKIDIKRELMFISQLLLKIVIWVLGAVLIYWLVLKVTGHSPTSETVFMGALGIIVALQMFTLGFVIRNNREIGEIKRAMKDSDRRFYALARDFKEFKNHTH